MSLSLVLHVHSQLFLSPQYVQDPGICPNQVVRTDSSHFIHIFWWISSSCTTRGFEDENFIANKRISRDLSLQHIRYGLGSVLIRYSLNLHIKLLLIHVPVSICNRGSRLYNLWKVRKTDRNTWELSKNWKWIPDAYKLFITSYFPISYDRFRLCSRHVCFKMNPSSFSNEESSITLESHLHFLYSDYCYHFLDADTQLSMGLFSTFSASRVISRLKSFPCIRIRHIQSCGEVITSRSKTAHLACRRSDVASVISCGHWETSPLFVLLGFFFCSSLFLCFLIM